MNPLFFESGDAFNRHIGGGFSTERQVATQPTDLWDRFQTRGSFSRCLCRTKPSPLRPCGRKWVSQSCQIYLSQASCWAGFAQNWETAWRLWFSGLSWPRSARETLAAAIRLTAIYWGWRWGDGGALNAAGSSFLPGWSATVARTRWGNATASIPDHVGYSGDSKVRFMIISTLVYESIQGHSDG